MYFQDDFFMQAAFEQADCALKNGEVPIGAVIVSPTGVIVSRAYNTVESTKNPLAHAEILAITQAAQNIGDWRLAGYRLYVTLEPCALCMQAIIRSRVSVLVFGARSTLYGFSLDRYTTFQLYKIPVTVREGLGAERAVALLRRFFGEKRRKRSEQKKSGSPFRGDS